MNAILAEAHQAFPVAQHRPVIGITGNYGELTTNGWEATLSWRDSFKLGGKDFQYSIKGSVWDSRTFVSKFLAETGNILTMYKGKEIGEIWGFRTDGYFLNYTEANNWATDTYHKNGSNFREYAGDLKFIDVDGNGTITNYFTFKYSTLRSSAMWLPAISTV